MSSTFIALLCLCFVSFGCTQPGTNSSTVTGRPFQQNVQTVFSFMDRLILQDNRITFDEFEKVMMQSDSNKDGLISLQEMGVAMDKLKLVPSSTATMIFRFIDVRPTDTYLNRSELQSLFSLFDSNNDGNIVLSEFMASSNSLPSLVKMVG